MIGQVAELIAVGRALDKAMMVTATRAAIARADLVRLSASWPIVRKDNTARITTLGAPMPSTMPRCPTGR
ncbi:hypothetical protein, partial [Burkholderia pyrrocinia]|uniref:hypothetical protein n=1 Tax=Burkholderia pyrrocinia TaxID=60550 RepID=UPI002AB0BE0A